MFLKIIDMLVGRKPEQTISDPLILCIERTCANLGSCAGPLDVLRAAYLAQIVHIGRHGAFIFPDDFKASAMGPMNVRALEAAKTAIRRQRRGLPYEAGPISATAAACIDQVCRELRHAAPARLVAAVQSEQGAWARHFAPDPFFAKPISDPERRKTSRRDVYDGAVIPKDSLRDEYALRIAA